MRRVILQIFFPANYTPERFLELSILKKKAIICLNCTVYHFFRRKTSTVTWLKKIL